MSFKLVFDITSNVIKCAIGNEKDEIVKLNKLVPKVKSSPDGFRREHDPKAFWDDIITLARKTILDSKIDPKKIRYVSCSSIRPSCIFTDENYDALYIGSNFDLRGIETADYLEERFKEISGKSIFEATGHFPALMFAPARLAWFKENENEIASRITNYLPMDSWILIKMGAEEHANICSAAESGFYDVGLKAWNDEWLDILDLSLDFFPFPIKPGEVVGNVTEEMGDLLGINDNACLVSGLPDTQAALVGAGCVDHGQAATVIGSTAPTQFL
ncbi:MAG: FGGY family carbohydrate kinase, partial [Promethearchaeota archaeon]